MHVDRTDHASLCHIEKFTVTHLKECCLYHRCFKHDFHYLPAFFKAGEVEDVESIQVVLRSCLISTEHEDLASTKTAAGVEETAKKHVR